MAARLPMHIGGFRIIVFALLAALMAGCASSGHSPLRANTGDMIVERLKIGMSNAEIDAAIADMRKWIISDGNGTVQSEFQLYWLYQFSYFPKDVLKTVEVGTPCRYLEYWTNPAGHQTATVKLFYDADQRLRGWVNYPSAYSQDKFMHERLTSKLRIQSGSGRGMTHQQVHALIGLPTEVITPPAKRMRSQYEDHFWHTYMTQTPPVLGIIRELEVYSYSLDDGSTRRVYLGYYPAAKGLPDELALWGYDHAWEEAERYEREKAKSP